MLVKLCNTHQGRTALAVDRGWKAQTVKNNVSIHQKGHYPWIGSFLENSNMTSCSWKINNVHTSASTP